MKRPTLFLLLTLAAGCAGKTDAPPGSPEPPDDALAVARPTRAGQASAEDVQAVARGVNAFAFDLYRELKGKSNAFFSPFSASTALSMTYAGARGDTAKEMSKVLHYPFEGERLHLGYAGLLGKLSGPEKPAGVQLSVANALWGSHDYKEEFVALNRDYYAAHVRKIVLVGAEPIINGWAAQHTAGRIKDLLPPKTLTEVSLLVLTNAIYFKGDWQTQFKKEDTRDEPFRVPGRPAVKAPMMRQTTKLRYHHDSKGDPAVKVLELPYVGGDVSMVIVLPDADDGLEQVEKALTAKKLEGWLSRMSKPRVRVLLPRFTISGDTVSLKEPLQRLGMVLAFERSKANFTGLGHIAAFMYINEVLQKAFVEVNEKGSEAAAATAVILDEKDGRRSEDDPVNFIADHPFLFLIRDTRTGCVLFLGRLHSPK